MYWAEADEIASSLRTHLATCPQIEQLEFAGSYRRGKDTVGDLDLLVVSRDVAAVMDRFGEFPAVASVLARGETKMSVRTHQGFQIDLRVVEAKSFGAALQYFTGSKDHNVVLRGRARQRGTEDQRIRRVSPAGRGGRVSGRGCRRGRLRGAGPAGYSSGAARSTPRIRVGGAAGRCRS